MAEPKENIQAEFRGYLKQADKFLVEGNFAEARNELVKAKKLDPHNPFILAFQERITHFESKANPAKSAPAPAESPACASAPRNAATCPRVS